MISINVNIIEGDLEDILEYFKSNYEILPRHNVDFIPSVRYLLCPLEEQLKPGNDEQKIFYLQNSSGINWECKHVSIRILE